MITYKKVRYNKKTMYEILVTNNSNNINYASVYLISNYFKIKLRQLFEVCNTYDDTFFVKNKLYTKDKETANKIINQLTALSLLNQLKNY